MAFVTSICDHPEPHLRASTARLHLRPTRRITSSMGPRNRTTTRLTCETQFPPHRRLREQRSHLLGNSAPTEQKSSLRGTPTPVLPQPTTEERTLTLVLPTRACGLNQVARQDESRPRRVLYTGSFRGTEDAGGSPWSRPQNQMERAWAHPTTDPLDSIPVKLSPGLGQSILQREEAKSAQKGSSHEGLADRTIWKTSLALNSLLQCCS